MLLFNHDLHKLCPRYRASVLDRHGSYLYYSVINMSQYDGGAMV